ncbi:MAG: IS110 family transposase [Proteobacteria bacterium]|nr:MAG: IS110 family transposase [Pseudomonadota bacterium]
MQNLKLVGIDIAKSVFQLQGCDQNGKPIFKKKLSRKDFLPFIRQLPTCIIAMEACGGSHFFARYFRSLGHEVRLISPQFVKPFVKGNKNDRNDAAAICEAAVRPSMHFVPIKEEWHQSVQTVHRIRSERVARKTKLQNMLRAILVELGFVTTQGTKALKDLARHFIDEQVGNVSRLSIQNVEDLLEDIAEVEKRIEKADKTLKEVAESSPSCKKIMKIKGLGPATATALVAATPDPHAFKNGRQYAAWLGLVPRHSGTGGKVHLGKISKRGDKTLRSLLVHGGRSALRYAVPDGDKLSKWACGVKERRGSNKAAVALAHKNARIIWALLAKGAEYDPKLAA